MDRASASPPATPPPLRSLPLYQKIQPSHALVSLYVGSHVIKACLLLAVMRINGCDISLNASPGKFVHFAAWLPHRTVAHELHEGPRLHHSCYNSFGVERFAWHARALRRAGRPLRIRGTAYGQVEFSEAPAAHQGTYYDSTWLRNTSHNTSCRLHVVGRIASRSRPKSRIFISL